MEIMAVEKAWLPEMAALFVQNLRKLRLMIPLLPDRLENVGTVMAMLADLSERCPGVVAVDSGKVIGYMLWLVVDRFRNTERKGAYCPEWGHAAIEERKPQIYRAMYRAAATEWVKAGCQVHALTLLAHDHQAQDIWFWNGFGLVVVDALRELRPLDLAMPTHFSIRQASLADVNALGTLEIEHAYHYTQAPTLMNAYEAQTASALTQFLSEPDNSIWVAMDHQTYAGYMRFDANSDDSVTIVSAPDTIANTGAYVRVPYRGQRIAATLLSTALQHYHNLGYQRCSVDFESFNPEAAAFWPRYFNVVCFSLMRMPEK